LETKDLRGLWRRMVPQGGVGGEGGWASDWAQRALCIQAPVLWAGNGGAPWAGYRGV